MSDNLPTEHDRISAFEKIRRVNDAGNEYWVARDLCGVLGYAKYQNFETVIAKAKEACFNSGQRIEEHFTDVSKMIEIGKGGRRKITEVYLSRYACYLLVQNADPSKPVVATGQTYFAVQTRRQELAGGGVVSEDDLRLGYREDLKGRIWRIGRSERKCARRSRSWAVRCRRICRRLSRARSG